jgi:hypothetical protein
MEDDEKVPLIPIKEAPTPEQRLSSLSNKQAEQRMSDTLSQSSSQMSIIGGTVLYDQHLTEHALARK